MKKLWTICIALLLCANTANAQTNVVFYTTEGNFMVEIREDLVPITGNNFLDLVNAEFYDGIIFHRVIDGFIIQGGDPLGTGFGGPGYTIQDEFHPSLDNAEMTISMANAGPNTGGSQFFINLDDNFFLDYDVTPLTSAHAVFGTVTQGYSVAQQIGAVPVDANNKPLADVVMDSIRVTDTFVGLEDIAGETSKGFVKVYPNPITKNSVIRVNTQFSGLAKIDLYGTLGEVVAHLEVNLEKGQNTFSFEPLMGGNLASGMYYVHVSAGEEMMPVTRIVIP